MGGGEEEEEGEGFLEGFGVVEGFFFFLFLFGGREGGGGVTETVEWLSDGGERGEGAVNGRERWKRGGRVEDVRGEFWCGRWRGGMVSAFFSVFWISLGGALGEVFFIVYSEGREGGGERGEEGGEIGEKGIQGWRGKEEEKDGGEKKGEIGMRELSL